MKSVFGWFLGLKKRYQIGLVILFLATINAALTPKWEKEDFASEEDYQAFLASDFDSKYDYRNAKKAGIDSQVEWENIQAARRAEENAAREAEAAVAAATEKAEELLKDFDYERYLVAETEDAGLHSFTLPLNESVRERVLSSAINHLLALNSDDNFSQDNYVVYDTLKTAFGTYLEFRERPSSYWPKKTAFETDQQYLESEEMTSKLGSFHKTVSDLFAEVRFQYEICNTSYDPTKQILNLHTGYSRLGDPRWNGLKGFWVGEKGSVYPGDEALLFQIDEPVSIALTSAKAKSIFENVGYKGEQLSGTCLKAEVYGFVKRIIGNGMPYRYAMVYPTKVKIDQTFYDADTINVSGERDTLM